MFGFLICLVFWGWFLLFGCVFLNTDQEPKRRTAYIERVCGPGENSCYTLTFQKKV